MDTNKPLPYWVSIPCVLIFVAGFRFFFGHENAAVGLTFFSALVIFSRYDYMRITPLKYGVGIILVSAFIATTSYFAGLSPYTGLVINIAALFSLVYFLFGTFQNQLYIPAMMAYLYLLNSPEPLSHIWERVFAIVVGTTILFIALTALQRTRASATISAQFQRMLGLVANKARELAGTPHADYVYTSTEDIRKALHTMFTLIYRAQKNNHATRVLDEMRISFALALERFVVIIQQIKHSRPITPQESIILVELAELLDHIALHFKEIGSFKTLTHEIDAFVSKHVNAPELSIEMFELLETCSLTSHQLRVIGATAKDPNKQRVNVRKSQWMKEVDQAIKPHNLRLNFALKFSLTVSLLLFLAHLSGIQHGQWLAYTVAFLLRPYVEDTSSRTRDRTKGTLIAAVIFMVVFGFVNSMFFRLSLIMVAYIIYSRARPLSTFQVTCTSFAALGSMALITGDFSSLGYERIIYVAIGVPISILVAKYIAPYHIVTDTSKLLSKYRHTTYRLLSIFLFSRLREHKPKILSDPQIADTSEHRSLNIAFKGLLMNASLIEQQITFNNRRLHSPRISNFFIIEHQLVNDIYFMFATLSMQTAQSEGFLHLLHGLQKLVDAYQGTPVDEFYQNENLIKQTDELLTAVEAAIGFCEEREKKMALITLESAVKEMRQQLEFDLHADALVSA